MATYFETTALSGILNSGMTAPSSAPLFATSAPGSASSLVLTWAPGGIGTATPSWPIFVTPVGDPSVAGSSGVRSYSVTVNVTNANMNVGATTGSLWMSRVNAAGTIVQSAVLSSNSIDWTTTGVKTYSGSCDIGPFAAGDRLAVEFRVANASMSAVSVTLEVGLSTESFTADTIPWIFGSMASASTGVGVLLLTRPGPADLSVDAMGDAVAQSSSSMSFNNGPTDRAGWVQRAGSVVGQNATGATSFDIPITAPTSAGNVLLLRIALISTTANTLGTNGVYTDSKGGNGYTEIRAINGLSAGIESVIVATQLVNALMPGDTITVNTTPAPDYATAWAAIVDEYTGLQVAREPNEAGSFSLSSGTSPTATVTPDGTSTFIPAMITIRGPVTDAFTEDTDTLDAQWVSRGRVGTTGSTSNEVTVTAADKMTSVSQLQTYNPTLGTARTYLILINAMLTRVPISGQSASTSNAHLTLGPTWVMPDQAQAAGSGSLVVSTPVVVAFGPSASLATTSLTVIAPMQLPLQQASATGSSTATVTAPTSFVLTSSAAAVGTATVTTVAPLALSSSAVASAANLTPTTAMRLALQQGAVAGTGSALPPLTGPPLPLQQGAAAAVASMALRAQALLTLSSAATATATGSLTAQSFVALASATAAGAGALLVTGTTYVALVASSAAGSGTFTLRIRALLRPNGDLLTGWTSDQATHSGALDDALEQPTVPVVSSDFVTTSAAGQTDRVSFDDVNNLSGVANGTLWVYAQAGGVLSITIELYKGATLVGSTVVAGGAPAGWFPIAFTGLTQAEINSLEMRLAT